MVRHIPDNSSVPSTLFKHIVLALTRFMCFLKTAARPDPDIIPMDQQEFFTCVYHDVKIELTHKK